jgi:hypothetical protein
LAAAVGNLGLNLNHFPRDRFKKLASDNWAILDKLLNGSDAVSYTGRWPSDEHRASMRGHQGCSIARVEI